MLLLYLADELSPPDRAEVERQLQRDPALRAELDGLRESQDLLHARLESLDASTPLAAAEATAVRNVSRVLRQRHARPLLAASPAALDTAQRRFPRWAYPAAVAAAVALVAGVTWKSLAPSSQETVVDGPTPEDVETQFVQLDPWEDHAVSALSREVAVAPLPDGLEVAATGYDQPLFDIPFSVPQEGGQPEP